MIGEGRGVHKRSQTRPGMQSHQCLVNNHIATYGPHVHVVNCMGLRAQESSARAKKAPFERNARLSNTKRTVDNWLPIHDWTEAQVWELIRSQGLPYNYAYDLGMPRLSCALLTA